MSQDALLARLEAAVERLEKLQGTSGASKASASAGDDSDMSASGLEAVEAYDTFYQTFVPPFLAACAKFPDLANVAKLAEGAFKNQGDLVRAAAVSKKATDQEVVAFLKPCSDAIQQSDNMDFKSGQYTHQQAFNASVGFLTWPFARPPLTHIEGMIDSGTMYLNRILMKAKDAEEPQKTNDRDFVNTFKAVLAEFANFVKAHFKAGLEWNPKGKTLAEFQGGAAPAPAAAKPAPVAAPAAAAAPAKPTGNVFAELNQGLAITSGLRKVTDDMKAKNMKDVPALEAKKPIVPAAKKDVAPVNAKPPSTQKTNSGWVIEWYNGDNNIEVKDLDIRDGVYLGNLRNCTVVVTGKAKSISIDKCFRTNVYFTDVLSSVEVVNSDRVTVYVTGNCPTVAIDKSKGIVINFNDVAIKANPDIITSNISECNVQIPGATEDDDLVEIPLAEQFLNKLDGKKISVSAVTHG